MENLKTLYIDNTTSRYFSNAIESLFSNVPNSAFTLTCKRFDWNINNENNEFQRLFKVINENNINMFFIDSALYETEIKKESKFLGVWIAYVLKVNIPRAHIAIVSSMHDSNTSLSHPSFPFLSKISKDSEENTYDEFRSQIKNWIHEDEIFKKCCIEFINYGNDFGIDIKNEIDLSLARMDSKKDLSKDDISKIIELLQGIIDCEE